MSRTDELRAALELAELEEELIAAKADGSVTPELKNSVRAARAAARQERG